MNLPLRTVLASSSFLALLAVGQKALAYEAETVSFTGPAGTTLTGVRYVPDDFETVDEARPAVVLLHGCTGIWSNRTVGATNADGTPNLQNHIEKWGIQLADSGYVALVVDSYTPREPTTLNISDAAARAEWQNQCSGQTNAGKVNPYTTRVLDARAAWDYLTGDDLDDQVDADRIGLLGWSQGAQSAMVEAADATRDNKTPLRATTDLLFATTVVYYPGCGSDLGFGYASSGWWRPYSDFRMNIAKLDTLHGNCQTRYNRGVTNWGSSTAAPDMEMTSYDGADHSFDAASQAWPTSSCATPFSGDVCAMNDADLESFDFFETYL